MENTTYAVRCTETGTAIDTAIGMTAAKALVAQYEASDRAEGSFTLGFYEIVKVAPKKTPAKQIYIRLQKNGHGRYVIYTEYYGKEIKGFTDDMTLIDDHKLGIKRATKALRDIAIYHHKTI